LRGLPEINTLTERILDLSERLTALYPRTNSLDLENRQGFPEGTDREELGGLRTALRALRTGLTDGHFIAETQQTLRERSHLILDRMPCWAVTNLSAGSRIPLVGGLFDLAIVDEASQSDIPSAIPILFRAKRAGVVGDPFQLTHCSKLSIGRDAMLRQRTGIIRIRDLRCAYTESSLYDLFAGTNDAKPIFLSETYRSAFGIADYSNQTFYGDRLRVATDQGKLRVPQGMKSGIHWTEIAGEIKAGGGSGCICLEEVDEIVQLIHSMLAENNFRGTLGVVTPFRQQANRLQDALYGGEIPYQLLEQACVHVDTAHGFQGDERDVILLSLCAGPDMPRGSRSFLRETGNLFNVAVSRARAVLHVVGNREWAKNCGIHHIQNLARERGRIMREPKLGGPWHPHESPWEKKLFEALVDAGLKPVPQYAVSGRRLDLALLRTDDRTVKIDIEVDGDCHRNPDGSRKEDDIWRDIQLQGMGWKVLRFWVYQLREDMNPCVRKIRGAWEHYE
ncbi:AAA domain-containing protein, partial [Nitrospinota bacterium]